MDGKNSPVIQSTLSVEYKIDLDGSSRKRKGNASKKTVKKLPQVTRLLALSHHLQHLIDNGVVKDYAGIARLSNLSRARLTQIMNLTLLAPNIQEEILSFSVSSFVNIRERNLRTVLKTPIWEEQYKIWKKMTSQ